MPDHPVIAPTRFEADRIVATLAARIEAGDTVQPLPVAREFGIDIKTARLLIDIAAGEPQGETP